MQKFEKRLSIIMKKYNFNECLIENFDELEIVKILQRNTITWNYEKWTKKIFYCAICLIFIIGFFNYFHFDKQCIFEMPRDRLKIFRKPENCDICKNVQKINKVSNITPEEFEIKYIVKSEPVVIKDAAKNWSAMKVFSFEFFKNLYEANDYEGEDNCQFFPYKTEFNSLREVFNMSAERSNLKDGTLPWYVGWSNCNEIVAKELRKHYSKPYFLSDTSEDIALNWIFMGTPGYGAHMHVDNVQYPSWQAQIRGRKKWILAPPPECLYSCNWFEVVVEPSEIIVVDTNRWYHQTFIQEGDISITVGAEFD